MFYLSPSEGGVSKCKKVVCFDISPFEGGVSKAKRLFSFTFYLSREESRKVKGGLFYLSPFEEGVSKGQRWFILPFAFRDGFER